MDLVPLKVTVGLKTEKRKRFHAYPPFNEIPETLRDGMDWSYFVDQHGGWHYDHIGHDEEDAESPRGTWFGMLLVPADFATEAVSRWPEQCSILNEAQAKQFYEYRVTIEQPEIIEDLEALQIIAAKRGAGLPETEEDRAALDPDNPKRGRTRNKRKKFADMLALRGLKLKK
jgi:hypothetical protein